jgi:hypothetical protein
MAGTSPAMTFEERACNTSRRDKPGHDARVKNLESQHPPTHLPSPSNSMVLPLSEA